MKDRIWRIPINDLVSTNKNHIISFLSFKFSTDASYCIIKSEVFTMVRKCQDAWVSA